MTEPVNNGTGLLEALRAVQAEAPTLPKDKTNPHFKSKYTGLDTIVEKVAPLLAENGLVWSTLPGGTHDAPTLAYRLAHARTGEVLEGVMPLLLDKTTAQGFGSALTYARRYALTSVLNLVADEDDDGNAAAAGRRSATGKPAKAKPAKASGSTVRRIRETQEKAGVTDLDVLNILRTVRGGTPLEINEEQARTRLEAGIHNVRDDEVDVVLQRIDEVAGS